MVTGKCRASYAHVFTPQAPIGGGDPKYSMSLLIPKTDSVTLNAIFAEIEKAKQTGASQVWGNKIPPNCAISLYDGDGPRPSDGEAFGEECKGHFVLRTSSKQRPSVVDMNLQSIIDPGAFYSGCYVRASINFFPYSNNGKKGVGCGLNNIQKIADGEPLSSKSSPEEDFGGANTYSEASWSQYVPGGAPLPVPAYIAPVAPTAPPAQYQSPQIPMAPPVAPTVPGNSYGVPYQQYQQPVQPPQMQPAYQQTQAPAQYQQPQPQIDPVTGYPMTGIMGLP